MRFPKLTAIERAAHLLLGTFPSYARAAAIPRPLVEALLDRLDVDRHYVALLDRVRDRTLGLPVRVGGELLLLSPRYVRRVLGGSDFLYSPDTARNRTALEALAPRLVTLSRDRVRAARRAATVAVLDTGATESATADRFAAVAAEEIDAMLDGPARTGQLHWSDLRRAFDRAGRRCVLGDDARDDVTVTALVARLSRYPHRLGRHDRWSAELVDRIDGYADAPQRGSLLARIADRPGDETADLLGQVPYWLLSVGHVAPIAAHALALLATHPAHAARVTAELDDATRHHGVGTAAAVEAQPFLQATITEAARLWPPIPRVHRETTRPCVWETVALPTGTRISVDLRYLARSRRAGGAAHRFTPRQWLDGTLDDDWSVLPFGAGRAGCAGAMLGVHLAVAGTAAVLRRCYIRAVTPRWQPGRPLPVTHSASDVHLTVAERPVEFIDATARAATERTDPGR